MLVEPSPEKVLKLSERLVEAYSRERPDIHVSDIALCIRQSAYKRLVPRPPTLEQVGYYVDGARRDLVLKDLFKSRPESKQVNGVWFTPDGLDENGDPIESKATRSRTRGEPSPHYVTQLLYYMALMGRNHGTLVIQHISAGETDPFEVFDVSINDYERESILLEIESKRLPLELALESKNPALAPNVREDPERKWCCRTCNWKQECHALPA